MKSFCLVGALFLFALSAFSQSVTIAYDILNQHNSPEIPVGKAMLTDNGNVSKFLIKFPEKLDWTNKVTDGLIKDKAASLYYSEESFVKTRFGVKDSLHTMKWRLTGKSRTILGYPCLSATTTFRGRAYTAYYTTKLPSSNGPWKLGGLPGLILDAKTDDGYQQWQATDVKLGQVPPIDLAKVQARNNLDWKSFVAAYREKVIRQAKYVRSRGILPADNEIKMKIESLEIFYPELQTGEGLSY